MRKRSKNIKLYILYTLVIALSIGLLWGCNDVKISDGSDLKTYPEGNPIDTVSVTTPDTTIKDDYREVLSFPWKYFIIHCTATSQNATSSSIQRYWEQNLGWDEPGYHFLIYPNGNIHIYKSFDFSDKITINDRVNSVKGINRFSVAVSYIGGIDSKGKPKDTRTEEQKETLDMLVHIARETNPDVKVVGHRDVQIHTNKACPSFDVMAEYSEKSFAEMSVDTLHNKLMERVKVLNK